VRKGRLWAVMLGFAQSQGTPDSYVSIARAKDRWDEDADTLFAVWTALKWPPLRCPRKVCEFNERDRL
jgi:hypothetical protein